MSVCCTIEFTARLDFDGIVLWSLRASLLVSHGVSVEDNNAVVKFHARQHAAGLLPSNLLPLMRVLVLRLDEAEHAERAFNGSAPGGGIVTLANELRALSELDGALVQMKVRRAGAAGGPRVVDPRAPPESRSGAPHSRARAACPGRAVVDAEPAQPRADRA